MVKFEDLKDGMILVLTSDVTDNPMADRRVRRDWRALPTIPKGTRFVVRRDGIDINDPVIAGRRIRSEWYTLQPIGVRCAGIYELVLHANPHDVVTDRFVLGRMILAACEVPALTLCDHWARLDMHGGDFQNVIEVLIASGKLSLAEVEAARQQRMCAKCDQLAVMRTAPGRYPSAFVAIDPKTGSHLRPATNAEIAAYLEQPAKHPSFRKMIRVGDVLIDEYTGPGISNQSGFDWL